MAVMDPMTEDMIIMMVMIGVEEVAMIGVEEAVMGEVEEVVMLMTGFMAGLDIALEQDIKMESLIWKTTVVMVTCQVAVHKEKG